MQVFFALAAKQAQVEEQLSVENNYDKPYSPAVEISNEETKQATDDNKNALTDQVAIRNIFIQTLAKFLIQTNYK